MDEILYEFTFISIGILQVISGLILVKGVYKVRLFFLEKEAETGIDTVSLMVHSLSFLLYLLAGVVYYVMFTIHVFQPDTEIAWVRYFEAGIAMFSLNFIAQVLLITVFWEQAAPMDESEFEV